MLSWLAPAQGTAGLNRWTSNGPAGEVSELVLDPTDSTTLYAAAGYGGVAKSTDGGATWTTSLIGERISAYTLAVASSAPLALYAGTGDGVFKSTDAGQTWVRINTGLMHWQIHALAVHPTDPSVLYAGTGLGGGVYKSTDAGASWIRLTFASSVDIAALAIDPSAPATIYAGTLGSGIFKSTDGGGHWAAANLGLTNQTIYSLAIDPSAPATLYAGSSGGVFKSNDGGGNWSAENTGLTGGAVFTLAIDPSAPATLYAGTRFGVFKSTNGGSGWMPLGSGLPSTGVYSLVIDPASPATLYAGTFEGIFKSASGGDSWSYVNASLTNTSVCSLEIDPQTPTTLYAGTSRGAFKSSDGARSWQPIDGGLPKSELCALAIDPSASETVYAGVRNGGVFKSTNGGTTWAAVNAGLPSPYVRALAIDPSPPTTLYVASGGAVFKSIDGGESWSPTAPGPVFIDTLDIAPSNPSVLYAGERPIYTGFGPYGSRIFKSADGGRSWYPTGLDAPGVNDVAISPSEPSTAYAATYTIRGRQGGVFRSFGNQWGRVGFEGLDVRVVAVDPFVANTVYAGLSTGGVFKSTDGGVSWVAMNTGLTNRYVRALAVDPTTPARLYAGTDGNGVFEYLSVEPCTPGPSTLCLNGGRFSVTTDWATRDGRNGSGQAVQMTEDTGYFTFFDPANVEVVVKVLNGCAFNSRFWTFAGGLTDVSVVMTVKDVLTGVVRTYTNVLGNAFRPIQDTGAFAACDPVLETAVHAGTSAAPPVFGSAISESSDRVGGSCVADTPTLCLNQSRYRVQAQWFTRDGASGVGRVVPMTSDTGAFWFFSPQNVEIVIKVLSGCTFNSRYWTFAAGLTDVEVLLTVTDTRTGAVREYRNPQGTPFQPIQDTSAFSTCP